MARKTSKILSAADILSFPDAPEGERGCDVPLSPQQQKAIDKFLQLRQHLHAEGARLMRDYDPDDFLQRAFETCNVTGLTLDEFNRLSQLTEIEVTRIAADMKDDQNKELAEWLAYLLQTQWRRNPCEHT